MNKLKKYRIFFRLICWADHCLVIENQHKQYTQFIQGFLLVRIQHFIHTEILIGQNLAICSYRNFYWLEFSTQFIQGFFMVRIPPFVHKGILIGQNLALSSYRDSYWSEFSIIFIHGISLVRI